MIRLMQKRQLSIFHFSNKKHMTKKPLSDLIMLFYIHGHYVYMNAVIVYHSKVCTEPISEEITITTKYLKLLVSVFSPTFLYFFTQLLSIINGGKQNMAYELYSNFLSKKSTYGNENENTMLQNFMVCSYLCQLSHKLSRLIFHSAR